jgi:hypothetical protein
MFSLFKYCFLKSAGGMSYNVWRGSEVLSDSEGFGRSVAKPDTRLLADPKGKPAKAGEEFRTPTFYYFNYYIQTSKYLSISSLTS